MHPERGTLNPDKCDIPLNSALYCSQWGHFFVASAVADPRFPRGGGANPQGRGAPGYDFIKISGKLHEIKENSVPRGGARPLRPPLDPPLL